MVPHMDEPQSQFPAVTVSELIKPELARGNGPTPPQKVHAMSNYNNSGAEPAVSDIRAQSHRGNGDLCGISKRIKLFLSKTLIRSMSRGGPNVCNLGFIWGAAPLYLSYFSRACDLPSLSQSRYRAGPGVATLLITHFAHEGSSSSFSHPSSCYITVSLSLLYFWGFSL